MQNAFPCSLSSMALFRNSCKNSALVGLCFFGGGGGSFGGWRFGAGGGGERSLGGGGRASRVLSLMFFYVH